MASASGTSRSNKQKREQSKRDDITDKVITQTLMKTPDGRRWIFMRLAEAGLYQATTDLDPQKLAWREGMRNSGLRLQASINRYAPEGYVEMLKENTRLEQIISDLEKEEEDGRDAPSEFD